jgi:crotonobetainyl-CoA:carnitine CoA-transferase CaiB-like acyl-CoA transferase
MSVMQGIRVLELGRVPPLELPGMMFADMGADVIKIDAPDPAGRDGVSAQAARRSHTNRNKRAISLDLKTADGVAAFMALAREADVLIEGFRPGVMQRMGIDHERLHAVNPRLVYCSMSGFGQTGPDRFQPAHDLNFLARSGVLDLMGASDEVPAIPLNLIADYGGAAMHAALAIMFALFERERGAPGRFIDISYLDCTVALLAATPNLRQLLTKGHLPRAGEGVFCGAYPYYTLYKSRDGRQLAVACSEPHLWKNFCDAIGLPELAMHARSDEHYRRAPSAEEVAARHAVQHRMAQRDASDWMATLAGSNSCVTLVNSVAQMLEDPQLRARGMVLPDGDAIRFGSPFRREREHTSVVIDGLRVNDTTGDITCKDFPGFPPTAAARPKS